MEQLGRADEQDASPATEVPLAGPTLSVRQGRRLSDKILVAFHHACDQSDLDSAAELLGIVARAMERAHPPATLVKRRRGREALAAAHERLWYLNNRYREAI